MTNTSRENANKRPMYFMDTERPNKTDTRSAFGFYELTGLLTLA